MKKVLYLECKTGAAGDMLMGALYGLLTEEQKAEFLEKMNQIREEVRVIPQEECKQGIGGIHMKVEINGAEEGAEEHHHHEDGHDHEYAHEHHYNHEHHHEEVHEHTHSQEEEHCHDHEHVHCHHEEAHVHNHEEAHCHEHTHDHDHMHDSEGGHSHDHHVHGHHSHTSVAAILEQISNLDFSDQVKKHAEGIYREIAAAESKVHRTDMDQIHFHEVGSVDALVDVVGSCLALEMLGVDEIQASPVCVGNGMVRCAHGVLPVPAPATAEIIKGMPVYSSSFEGELLTPTGAAILKYFVESYTRQMDMEIEEIGYGFGTKEFAQLSCVRAFLGYQK